MAFFLVVALLTTVAFVSVAFILVVAVVAFTDWLDEVDERTESGVSPP